MKLKTKIKGNKLQHGFTLIELLASITIIGILAALAFVKFGDVVNSSRLAKEQTVLSVVEKAKDLLAAEDGVKYSDLTAFNSKSANERFISLKSYIRLNGIEPTDSLSLLDGTGKAKLDPGLISVPSYTVTSGTSTSTVPAVGAVLSSLSL